MTDPWLLAAAGLGVLLVAVWILFSRLNRQPSDSAPLPPPAAARRLDLSALPATALEDLLIKSASQAVRSDLTMDPMALTRVREAAAKASAELDARGSATIVLPYLHADANGPKHFNAIVQRDEFGRVRVELQA